MSSRGLSGLIFAALALIVTGFAVALWFEAAAIWSGREATLSALSASAIASHPHLALLSGVLFGVLVGALAVHFTNWRA